MLLLLAINIYSNFQRMEKNKKNHTKAAAWCYFQDIYGKG